MRATCGVLVYCVVEQAAQSQSRVCQDRRSRAPRYRQHQRSSSEQRFERRRRATTMPRVNVAREHLVSSRRGRWMTVKEKQAALTSDA